MKCPLRLIGFQGDLGLGEFPQVNCLKDECAWWVDGEEGCLLVFIEKDLAGIWTMLTEIVNKMPHAGRFLK